MIKIEEESWIENAGALAPLFDLHHKELTDPEYVNKMKFNVDWLMFDAIDRAGNLLLVIARDEGKIIGYTVSVIHGHLHYKGVAVCQVDTYWVHPDHREPSHESLDNIGSTGAQLILETEEAAARRGAKKIINHTRFWHDNQRLFDLLGYRAVERISTKWIGG